MAKSSAIFSVAVATSAAGGGDQDSNALPDASGLTFTSMATTEASVDAFQASELSHEENHGRRSPGETSLAAIGVKNTTGGSKYGAADGEFIRVMYPDSIEVSARFRTGKGAVPTDYGFGKWLGSGMGLHSPGAATVTQSGAAGNKTEITVSEADAAHLSVGAPLRVRRTGATVDEYSVITQKGAAAGGKVTCKVHPEFTVALVDTQSINLCFAFFPVVGAAACATQDMHIRFDMGGAGSDASVRRLASLARCSGFSIAQDNFGTSMTLRARPACMLQDDANASTLAVAEPPSALLQHRFGARVDIAANHKGSSAPISGARTELSTFDWSFDCNIDCAPGTPNTKGVLGSSTMEIHNGTAQVTITGEADETLQRMIAKDELRTVILGMGPGGDGEGAALIVQNAGRADGDANPGAGDDNRIQQQTTLRAVSDFGGTDTTGLSGAALRLATAPFMLVLPKV